MLMQNYTGRQLAYTEAVRYFIGISSKYHRRYLNRSDEEKARYFRPKRPRPGVMNRYLPRQVHQMRHDRHVWFRQDPDIHDRKKRLFIGFGDASLPANMRGTLSI